MHGKWLLLLGLVWLACGTALAQVPPVDAPINLDPNTPLPWATVDPTLKVLPSTEGSPKQVNVSVKVVEFQTVKGVETGLSAYFARRNKVRAYGRVTSGEGAVTSADITFPASVSSGITVFLDRLRLSEGDMEITLQALVNEARATILSQPRMMVMLGSPIPAIIKTVDAVPYEETQVVGYNVVTVTKFRDTGVKMRLTVPQAIDDDGDWSTTADTYIMLNVEAEVNEAGQRFVVALDNAAGGHNELQVPEFVTRRVNTSVWVRHGQVLIMGGLYRDNRAKSVSTVPWLGRTEDLAVGLAERVVPGNVLGSPVSSTLGNRTTAESRRELVFLIKSEIWRPAYTVAPQHGFTDAAKQPAKAKKSPTDVFTDVLEGITTIPQGIAEGISPPRDEGSVESELGGGK